MSPIMDLTRMSGSKGSPFLTIGTALERVKKGEVIELAPSAYREVIKLNSKHGITIRAAESGTVKINPTERLPKSGIRKNGIWSLSYEKDIWQLFATQTSSISLAGLMRPSKMARYGG